jgi:drug/metabolite transporter (DMT)-like permease
MKKTPGLGFSLALAAPIAFTFFNAGVRIIADEMSVLGLLLLRGGVGLVLVGVISLFLSVKPWGKNIGPLCLIGFTGVLSSVCSTAGFTLIPLYQAVTILYLYPAMAAVLSAAVNKEKITRKDLFCVALAFVGSVVLVRPDGSPGAPDLGAGHLFSFAGGALYALSFVLARRLGDDNRGIEPLFFFSLVAVLAALPLSLISGVPLGIGSAGGAMRGAALGLIGSAAKFLVFAAIRFMPPHRVGVMGTLEILGGALASLLYFHDDIGPGSLAGGALILAAVLGLGKGSPPGRPDRGAARHDQTSK